MFRLIPTWAGMAASFLTRSPRTTAVLSLMVVAAVSTMIFLAALCEGVSDAMIRNSVELFTGHITCSNLPEGFPVDRLRTDAVKGILERAAFPGILMRGPAMDQILLIEVSPSREAALSAVAKKVVRGSYLRDGEPGILLSAIVAERLAVEPGQTVAFRTFSESREVSLEVKGVYSTGLDQVDRTMAFCPTGFLPRTQRLRTAAVFLKDGIEPQSLVEHYRSSFPGELSFSSWNELMPDLKQLIELNYVSMEIVLALVFGVMSLGIGCAVVIIVLKNIREFGVLKAMGVTSGELSLLIAFQVLWMTLSAALVGLLLGAGASWIWGNGGIDLSRFTSHNRYFSVSGVIFPRVTPFSLLTPPSLALLAGFMAALWPIGLVLRKKTADILRMI
jgi:ABC-type lipoprotein release transport system permease subunit